jgi:hypothetical protein
LNEQLSSRDSDLKSMQSAFEGRVADLEARLSEEANRLVDAELQLHRSQRAASEAGEAAQVWQADARQAHERMSELEAELQNKQHDLDACKDALVLHETSAIVASINHHDGLLALPLESPSSQSPSSSSSAQPSPPASSPSLSSSSVSSSSLSPSSAAWELSRSERLRAAWQQRAEQAQTQADVLRKQNVELEQRIADMQQVGISGLSLCHVVDQC